MPALPGKVERTFSVPADLLSGLPSRSSNQPGRQDLAYLHHVVIGLMAIGATDTHIATAAASAAPTRLASSQASTSSRR